MRPITFLALLVLFACSNRDAAPDVSSIKTNVSVERFDKDFFAMDTMRLQTSLQQLNNKYPAFLSLYFQFFAPVKDMAAQQNIPFDSALIKYYRFIKPLYNSVQQKFSNLNGFEKDLSSHLRYVKHYFPSFQVPVVLSSVESLNPENPTEIYGTTYYHDTLIVSLQMFLGRNYAAYDPSQYPEYLRRRFEPQYMLPNALRAITADLYLDSSQSGSLIEQMIEKGKQWWLMKKFLPDAPDSLITGFSALQTAWVQQEEGNVWGTINQNENLFSVEPLTIQNYIGEAPFTQTLPHGNNGEGAPGNIGTWLGLRIVQKFEERASSLSMMQILRTPAKKIFEGARYKPK